MLHGSLFALDIGGGTQDLFLWVPGELVENAVKLVLPSPTRIAARRLAELTEAGRAVFLTGRQMGGGPLTQAVRRHLARGLKVFAHPAAALTLHDNLARVAQLGVEITENPPPEAVPLTLGDVDLEAWQELCRRFAVPWPKHFAVAVQDHGFNPEGSNRRFRFQHWEAFLASGGRLRDLATSEPPAYLTRMRTVAEVLPGALLMDTCAAGVRGALLDPVARGHVDEGLTVVNLGNAHTFAALVQGERIFGLYEHHTGLLSADKLLEHLRRFQRRELTNEEVFEDEGHGCAYAPDYPPGREFTVTVITGPRRRLLAGWRQGVMAAPFGDMMLTGAFGLAEAFLERRGLSLTRDSLSPR
ncbi:MAG: DUF1786 domain-containing protein [Desulfobaccales bacterium]